MPETNERVKLKRGKSSTLPTAKESGSILIETDTGTAYVDNSDIERVQLKDPLKVSKAGDIMEGDLDMGDNKLTTTAEPTNDADVITKKYFDKNTYEYTGIDPIIIDSNAHEISHEEYGEYSGGPTSSLTLEYGGTVPIPTITSDKTGHVTEIRQRTVTMPTFPSAVQEAEHATTADSATEAEHATTADSATEAEHATTADSATEADHATEADTVAQLSTARTIDGIEFNGTEDVLHYGICRTEANVADKTVECENFTLIDGAYIQVCFTITNTASNPTLNVNDTGTKSITICNQPIEADILKADGVYTFVFSENAYELVSSGGSSSGPVYYRTDSVEDSQVEFRNITIIEYDENPEDVEAPAGSLILQRGASKYCLLTVITNEFSATKSYDSGDYCIYDDTLYRFTSEKSRGNWDSSKVIATTVMEEIISAIQAYNVTTASINALQERADEDEQNIQTLQSLVSHQEDTIAEMQTEIEDLNDQIKATLDPGDIEPAPGPAEGGDDDPDDDGDDSDDDDGTVKEEPGIIIPGDGDDDDDDGNSDDDNPDSNNEEPEDDGSDDNPDDDENSEGGDTNNNPDDENTPASEPEDDEGNNDEPNDEDDGDDDHTIAPDSDEI